MDLRLNDKVAIITGSSRGIGKAIAAGLAAKGCRVTLCARDAVALEQAAAELRATRGKVLAVSADLTRPENPSRIVEETVRTFGRIDILVNNISSVWGRETGSTATHNAVKASEISLAKSLARELATLNIRVNSVAPGSILFPGGSWDRRLQADPEGITQFMKSEIPFDRFGKPEEVADVVVFLCSERASWVTGACLNVDGGQSRSNI